MTLESDTGENTRERHREQSREHSVFLSQKTCRSTFLIIELNNCETAGRGRGGAGGATRATAGEVSLLQIFPLHFFVCFRIVRKKTVWDRAVWDAVMTRTLFWGAIIPGCTLF